MVDKGNQLLKDVEEAFGWPKERRKQSYAALRSVLHPLRDRLPVETTVQFGAQLPTLVRSVYYNGGRSAVTPVEEAMRAAQRAEAGLKPRPLSDATAAPSGSCGHGSGGCHSNIKIVASSVSSLC
ncbi:hypothetical protein GCM10010297_22060 [Streptomyces malachitofuscus]|nr:hypothetical protein GCM10010297_22060 [Streptomyces malachitofuscus]